MTIERLLTLSERGGMRPGLETTLKMRRVLGLPDYAYTTIHVAGTNGKGSVSTKIAQGLQEAGHRVGLFTSPHLIHVRERFQVNGRSPTDAELDQGLSELFGLAEAHSLNPTYFELCTLFALTYFADKGVDYGVFEVGMGGRLDATNVIEPRLAVITSIALDHQAQLGRTREAIAAEKGGIIKPGVPLVLGPNAQGLGLEALADPLHLVSGEFADYREENRAIAREALQLLGVAEEAIERGCQKDPVGRFQTLSLFGGTLILDAAHNPEALRRLFALIHSPVRMIAGFTRGHDLEAMLAVCQRADSLALVNLRHERGVVLEGGRPFEEVWEEQLAAWDPQTELLLIAGSCYLLSEFFGLKEDLERRFGSKIGDGLHTTPPARAPQPS